jgi:hypothetical protein
MNGNIKLAMDYLMYFITTLAIILPTICAFVIWWTKD